MTNGMPVTCPRAGGDRGAIVNNQASRTDEGGSDFSGVSLTPCSGSLEVEGVRAVRRCSFCSCFTFLASSFCRLA